MKKAALAVLCVLSINAQDAALETFLRTNWTAYARTRDLPPAVQEAIGPMSDPGQRFSKGCTSERRYVLFGPGLPFRRLEFAGASGNQVFAYYEHGGFAHWWTVETFEVDALGHARQTGTWAVGHETSIEALKAALKQTQGR